MKKKVLFAIFTEYQLLLSINEINNSQYADTGFEKYFLIKRSQSNGRLNQALDFSALDVTVKYWDEDINFNRPIPINLKNDIEELLAVQWDTFIYFQEQDPLVVLLTQYFARKKTKNFLFQDGLKPYNKMKSRSLGQVKNNIKQTVWLQKQGFKHNDYFSFVNCHKYGFLKGTHKLFLTFPEAYDNWNRKPIENIKIENSETFKNVAGKVFLWEENLLKETENAIFFVSQFMRDDGTFELNLINYLIENFKNSTIYIKFHPLTLKWDQKFVASVKSLCEKHNIIIITSKIPAELFIMQLTDSIIISSISTSMFLDNKACRFYYTYEIAKSFIPRFNRYDTFNPTPHVKTLYSFEEII
jgi:hypothetical protein